MVLPLSQTVFGILALSVAILATIAAIVQKWLYAIAFLGWHPALDGF